METPQRHGYVYELRRASYAWYNRWLNRPSETDSEAPVDLEPERNLWCTDSGFAVKSLAGETSFTLTRRLASDTQPTAPVTADLLRRVLSLPAESGGTSRASLLSVTEKYDHVLEELDLVSEREIHVPAWVVTPLRKTGRLPAVVMLSDAGKDPLVDRKSVV